MKLVKGHEFRPSSGLSLVLVGLCVLGFILLAAPVQGANGGIKVVEEHREVQFPDDLSFTLTVEGGQDIVEVQLLFRTVGSDVWSYSYADFDPGRRITTTLDVRVGGPIFIPPATDLEYYYVIREAQGKVHQTGVQRVEYSDNRFQWERTRIGPLELLHHGISRSRVEAVSKRVEEALERVTSLLALEDARPMKGVIYNSNAEGRPAFPYQSDTISEAQVFGGFAFPEDSIFVGVGFTPRIIIHEATHVLWRQALGPNALVAPAWLNEGFASYMEPDSVPYSGRSLSSRGLSLRSMTRISGTPGSISTFYRKSESAVAYLIEEFGEDSFQQFVEKLAERNSTDEALLRVYGFDTEGLEERWANDVRGRPAPAEGSPAAGSPWIHFSSLVLGALALVLLASFVLRYLLRKLRPSPAAEDRLQPWEDPDLRDPEDDDRY